MDYALARLNMVESQIRTNKVTDPDLIAAFESVPRELFVPKGKRGIAYTDEALEIGEGRYMLEPMVLARLLQAAMPGPADVALDLACGTGYATALLSRLASTVVGVDDAGELVEQGNGILSGLEIDNAALVKGALTAGYRKQAPYNVILVNGAVETLPDELFAQLAEGGRLVTIEGGTAVGPGQAVLYEKLAGRIGRRILFDAGTPMLAGFRREPGFVF
ncbi:protein-L-isoaspartate O-methyltransferase [Thalassobaculum fulvum]|jgi:protein-L-isoaspartate(D-aspartate) O-methyltransferase|uniref:Protein-L-isoaspartate O-methyltransferase n=1 Tax=Thalassobaculum fulvum TaxID=1633335 RepID=A0A918XRY6_9PROT|nr:protein-L-isoaspartate O-methyltransferase [Thalassobaculum fulvum]GHD48341.1 protein-L-isoaspartate O-methyltransferase [Thalassobaculum fulvum]